MNKSRYAMLIVIISLLIGLTQVFGWVQSDEAKIAYTPENLLRLHVVGNSNSLQDQMQKVQIKDVILQEIEGLFCGVKDQQEALGILAEHQEQIEETIILTLKDSCQDRQVVTRLGIMEFPDRYYGDLLLPAGEYYAFQVILGEGEGENWWCILFPPLCFFHTVGNEPLGKDVKWRLFFIDFLKGRVRNPLDYPVWIKSLDVD